MSRLTILFHPTRSAARVASLANFARKIGVRAGFLALVAIQTACGSGLESIPPPRPVIIYSGARLNVDRERMQEINRWVSAEDLNIRDDPSFWVYDELVRAEVYPWENMRLQADSVWVTIPTAYPDARLPFHIYGHLHLMTRMGRQEEWLPEAPDAVGYDLERAIVARTADAWILGRTVFGTSPYGPLDELAYAKEAGFLDALIFTARPDDFAVRRAEWARANPGEMARYREWFLDTFSREPPGLRPI
ncbi:MAG: hypothetical protein OEO79_07215 [Gemmatimonadota bacterium]|nr:hypothetical protein [Gemmatimonadota bacterium]MDH3422073.1 hypothetical protein [Gemmatimonadota bacterium]